MNGFIIKWTMGAAGLLLLLGMAQGMAAPVCPPGCISDGSGGTTPPPTGNWWKPTGEAMEFQWLLAVPLKTGNQKHMGVGKTAWNGNRPPATDPTVYAIDGWENPKSTVKELHDAGHKVVCYIEVGAAENYREDYDQFPPETLGRNMAGWPDEKWIDIRHPEVMRIVKERIKMCADKNFDTIDPDLDASYVENTGFPLTKEIEISYMKELVGYAHSLGIGVLGKNPDSTADSFAADMADTFDGVLTEQCAQWHSCGLLKPYTDRHLLVFHIEYDIPVAQFCADDNAKPGWMGGRFNVNLDGSRREPCK